LPLCAAVAQRIERIDDYGEGRGFESRQRYTQLNGPRVSRQGPFWFNSAFYFKCGLLHSLCQWALLGCGHDRICAVNPGDISVFKS
jgi:hypothetical protein